MSKTQRTKVFLDIAIGGEAKGRAVFELFNDIVPRTAENFRALITGEKGNNANGVPLTYKKCIFHRVIKGFMIQSGDLIYHNGLGGQSIYGQTFEDENFELTHDKPFLLSMANSGPDTNSSQFFVTVVPTPHLDGKHVVFGRLLSGKSVIRAVEIVPTNESDQPEIPVVITDCGELPADYVVELNAPKDNDAGDIYEEYLADNDNIDTEDPDSVLKAISSLKEIGTKLFKAGEIQKAYEKYNKTVRYLKAYFPNDLEPEKLTELYKLKLSSYLNVALVGLKLGKNSEVIDATNEALEVDEIDDKSKSKALYRRGSAYLKMKNTAEALKDFQNALVLAPTDGAIKKGIEDVKKVEHAYRQNEKKAFSKMFK